MLHTSVGLIARCLSVSGFSNAAVAETRIERGSYLVNTIMACGNCHSPRDGSTAAVTPFPLRYQDRPEGVILPP